MGIIKTITKGVFACIAVFALMGILFLVHAASYEITTEPAMQSQTPTETQLFTPHGKYAETYIPSITEIGNGKDWYMTKKENQLNRTICTATYIKDEHRTVVITISVCPTVDVAKILYNNCSDRAPYVECPTIGVCDQSFQYVEEIPTQYEMYKEVGTGVIRDGNIIAMFKVFEDNMFFGINSHDMERYGKNIEKKINSV